MSTVTSRLDLDNMNAILWFYRDSSTKHSLYLCLNGEGHPDVPTIHVFTNLSSEDLAGFARLIENHLKETRKITGGYAGKETS